MNLGRYLKQKRERAGLTQWEVCSQFGASTAQYLSNVERSVCLPSDDLLILMAKLYRVPLTDLIDAVAKEKEQEIATWKKSVLEKRKAG